MVGFIYACGHSIIHFCYFLVLKFIVMQDPAFLSHKKCLLYDADGLEGEEPIDANEILEQTADSLALMHLTCFFLTLFGKILSFINRKDGELYRRALKLVTVCFY